MTIWKTHLYYDIIIIRVIIVAGDNNESIDNANGLFS